MKLTNRIASTLLTFFIGFFLTINNHAAGDIDTSFNAWAQFSTNGPVYEFLTLSDGKSLVGGFFSAVNGMSASSLVKLNTDGSIDPTFNAADLLKVGTVYAITIQPDGKILVGLESNTGSKVRRLNPDGSLDTTLSDINFNVFSLINDIELLPDGKFLVAGNFVYQNTIRDFYRFNSDGTPDNSFNTEITNNIIAINELQLLPGGKILVGGVSNTGIGFISRLNSNGSIDATFPNISINDDVNVVKILPDGKIIIAGFFQTVNGQTTGSITRLNSNGTLDNSFNPLNSGANAGINDVKIASDGKLLIGGAFTLYNNSPKSRIARLNADGTLDQTFTANLTNPASVNAVGFLSNDKILASYGNGVNFAAGFSAINSDGSEIPNLKYFAGRNFLARKIILQPDGKILVGGEFDAVSNTTRQGIARVNADGTIDQTFNPPSENNRVTAMALQPDGKILAAFIDGPVKLRRLNADGSVDPTFSSALSGAINDILVLSNGKILVGGGMTFGNLNGIGIVKLNPNGAFDEVFNVTTNSSAVFKVAVQPDGKILIGRQIGMQRLNADGFIDGSFNVNVFGAVYDIVVQNDGKLIVAGSYSNINGDQTKRNIARLTSGSTIDQTFTTITDGFVTRVKIQSDGKLLIGGQFAFVNGFLRTGLTRLNNSGSLDNTFTASANETVNDIVLSGNKILISGVFTRINGISKVSLARLHNDNVTPKTAYDFDGDGRADIGVFRPGSSIWYQLLGPNYQFSAFNFGTSGDLVAPADYDGDGKTDLAIFRPSTGFWWYAASSAGNQFRAVQWGQAGDIPLPSDINGDGKDDYVLYRPSNNTWYRATESGTTDSIVFGTTGDKPLIGDFDGDGKADPSVFRPSTGTFWYAASSANNQFRAVQWGSNGDVAVPADYDGDGKTDVAVYRPSTGVWYILNSGSGSATIIQFGVSSDKPVAVDYDGDGKADIAVYRPSTGEWYILRSMAGFIGLQFGIGSDVAIPNAFIQ